MHYLFFIFVACFTFVLYNRLKSNPYNAGFSKKTYKVSSDRMRFIYDLTWFSQGSLQAEREILDTVLDVIRSAKKYILIDVFLFNKREAIISKHIPTTDIIIKALQKKNIPKIFITDPINTLYASKHSKTIEKLEKSGVGVVFTDLKKIPDNNLIYSGFWNLLFRWFGRKKQDFISNPPAPKRRAIFSSALEALNAKANHRKLVLADNKIIVGSSNFHNASSFYSNTGIFLEDSEVADYFFEAEKRVAKVSGKAELFNNIEKTKKSKDNEEKEATVEPLIGKEIKKSFVKDLYNLKSGDKVVIGMLFLADRDIIKILKEKSKNSSVDIKVILDQNRVSFGRKKIGFPNNFIAPELTRAGISVRWFKNSEDEYHAKYLFIKKKNKIIFNTGSANMTRRSLLATNLENNLRIEVPVEKKIAKEIISYSEKICKEEYSEAVKEKPRFYYLGHIWTRFAEKSGLAVW